MGATLQRRGSPGQGSPFPGHGIAPCAPCPDPPCKTHACPRLLPARLPAFSAQVLEGKVLDENVPTAVHHRKVGNHY